MTDKSSERKAGPKKLTISNMKVVMQALVYDTTPPAGGDPYAVTTAAFTKSMRDEFKGVAAFLEFIEPHDAAIRQAIKASAGGKRQ